MQQADDFLAESQTLARLIDNLSDAQLAIPTQFKNWTIEDIVGHLHMFNHAAGLALNSGEEFEAFFLPLVKDLNAGKSLLVLQNQWLQDQNGQQVIDTWRSGFEQLANAYRQTDPKKRISWAGPAMSARSSISARQMETWAHGQAVFDIFGLVREEHDRIKNIAHMGVTTYGWSFSVNNEKPPEPVPHVVLEAPSGEIWQWNDPQDDNKVIGSAVDFCQTVTQTRSIFDTTITTTGENAKRWMAQAQCFAGPPVKGPEPGQRFCVENQDRSL